MSEVGLPGEEWHHQRERKRTGEEGEGRVHLGGGGTMGVAILVLRVEHPPIANGQDKQEHMDTYA